jgi:hypothetical protein
MPEARIDRLSHQEIHSRNPREITPTDGRVLVETLKQLAPHANLLRLFLNNKVERPLVLELFECQKGEALRQGVPHRKHDTANPEPRKSRVLSALFGPSQKATEILVVPNEGAVRMDRSLWLASSSGCLDHHAPVSRYHLGLDRLKHQLAHLSFSRTTLVKAKGNFRCPRSTQTASGQERPQKGGFLQVVRALACINQTGEGLFHEGRLFIACVRRWDKQRVNVAVHHSPAQFGWAERRTEWDAYGTDPRDGKKRNNPVRAIGEVDRDPGALADPER